VFLASRRWVGGKAKTVQATRVIDAISLDPASAELETYLLLVQVEYAEAEPETYLVPLAFGSEERLQWTDTAATKSIIARLQVERGGVRTTGILFDPFGEEEFSETLLDLIGARRVLGGWSGKLVGKPGRSFRRLRGPEAEPLASKPISGEQSNSNVLFDQKLLMKLYRRLEPGVNPDVEISAFLTDAVNFKSIPPLAGTIEYRADRHQVRTLAILQGFVANRGNAWDFVFESLRGYFEKIIGDSSLTVPPDEECPRGTLLELSRVEIPPTAQRLFGGMLQSMELLARRTAELHLALSHATDDAAFAAEPFSRLYQRSLYQGVRNQATRALELLARRMETLQVETRPAAESLLARRDDILRRLRGIVDRSIAATRIRCHGDYHLGQVLYTGDDFVIIDFEGEPARPISERRIKTTPLRDVAGMLRSLDYACHAALEAQLAGMVVQESDYATLDRWLRLWVGWTSAAFLKSYLNVSADAAYIPRPREAVQALLDLYLMDKALYELQYELNNRPDWAHIPIRGLQRILEGEK
jgi:maltose alpha-D-glucosyltransferase/alpha-amylase